MGKCERCGRDFEAYCAKCRDEITHETHTYLPSQDIFVAIIYDRQKKLYYFGCNVDGCPCNTGQGYCSKALTSIMDARLHDFDGDNCIKQFCG